MLGGLIEFEGRVKNSDVIGTCTLVVQGPSPRTYSLKIEQLLSFDTEVLLLVAELSMKLQACFDCSPLDISIRRC